jgi:predicted transcriptional regulator
MMMKGITVKLSDAAAKELKRIGALQRRSVGFLIRDAVDFWLTDYLSREVKRTGIARSIVVRDTPDDHAVDDLESGTDTTHPRRREDQE